MLPQGERAVLVACAVAGGLAVPLHQVATPASAAVGGTLGLLGLHVWRWSGLPRLLPSKDRRWPSRLVELAMWWGLGLLVGLLLLLLIRSAIEPGLPSIAARIAAAGRLPVWRRVLIIYVAAVGEEVVFRLLLLSLVAGLTVRLLGRSGQVPSAMLVWCANVISALVFAAAHLPAWAGAGHLGVALGLFVMTLNALPGLLLGNVFATRGIVAAMWLHAGADSAIQLLGPLTR